jgi:hypothetical protein
MPIYVQLAIAVAAVIALLAHLIIVYMILVKVVILMKHLAVRLAIAWLVTFVILPLVNASQPELVRIVIIMSEPLLAVPMIGNAALVFIAQQLKIVLASICRA